MKIKPDEITSVIKQQIENYTADLNVDEVGSVLEVGDGIAHIYGIDKCMAGELLELPNGVYGMALNLEESNVVPYCWATMKRLKKATRSNGPAALCRCR